MSDDRPHEARVAETRQVGCVLSPKTNGYFYPFTKILQQSDGFVLNTSFEKQTISIRKDDGEQVTLQVIPSTKYAGARSLKEILEGDVVHATYLRRPTGDFALQVTRQPEFSVSGVLLSATPTADNNYVFSLLRATPRPTVNWIDLRAGHGQSVEVLALEPAETVEGTPLRSPDVGTFIEARIQGHSAKPDSSDRLPANDWQEKKAYIVLDEIKGLNERSSTLTLDHFPQTLLLDSASLATVASVKKDPQGLYEAVVALDRNDRGWTGRVLRVIWSTQEVEDATSIDLPPILDKPSASSSPLAEENVPTVHSKIKLEVPLLTLFIESEQFRLFSVSEDNLQLCHRHQRKFHPILWFITFGLAAIPQRDLYRVSYEVREGPEQCEFQIPSEIVQYTQDELRRKNSTWADECHK